MSLMDNGSNMFMPVAPAGYGSGSMGWGDGSFWIIVLFLFALMGNGWNGGFGGNAGAAPYFMNTNNDVQRGFDQSAVMNGISGIQGSLASAEVSRCNAQANILATLNANQNANTAAMNSLAMGLQNCCCENRQQIADVKYAIATDGAATRANTDAKVQLVLDKLCQQEIDALKAQVGNLQTQLNMANLAASQGQQTSQLLQDNNAQTAALINRLAQPNPVPAYIVQNPNGCNCGNTLYGLSA